MIDEEMAFAPGTVLNRQYRIERVLGRPGGFGITYLATDLQQNTRVAVKEFFPRDVAMRSQGEDMLRPMSQDGMGVFSMGLGLFAKEAKMLSRLSHPNIVRVQSYFEANGTGYLVMDYLEGRSLGGYLQQRQGNRLPAATATEIVIRVLDGLQHSHAQGILHRDIKPDNVYLTTAGRPILLDFGAARQAVGEKTKTVHAVLTPGFAPIEQYGHRAQGPWTDVYGCAALLYATVTGRPPLDAARRATKDDLVPPSVLAPDISPRIEDAIMKGLALYASDRPQSAGEFQDLLDQPSAKAPPKTVIATQMAPVGVPSQRTAPQPVAPPAPAGRPATAPMQAAIGADDDEFFTRLIAAYIGNNWESHYKHAWARLGSRDAVKSQVSWNWSSFLVPFWWLCYRRVWPWAGLLFVLALIPFVNAVAWVISLICFGLWGDRVILNRAREKSLEALGRHGPTEAALKDAAAAGGVSVRAVVLVILVPFLIGLIVVAAAISIPQFSGVKQKGYQTQMISDLTSLRTFQETYFTDSNRYTATIDPSQFMSSTGVGLPRIILGPQGSSWSATVTHQMLSGVTCGIAVAMPNPVDPLAGEGEPRCSK